MGSGASSENFTSALAQEVQSTSATSLTQAFCGLPHAVRATIREIALPRYVYVRPFVYLEQPVVDGDPRGQIFDDMREAECESLIIEWGTRSKKSAIACSDVRNLPSFHELRVQGHALHPDARTTADEAESRLLGINCAWVLHEFKKHVEAIMPAEKMEKAEFENGEVSIDPTFREMEKFVTFGERAFGASRQCPRDGRKHCSISDAVFGVKASTKANWFISWVWQYKLSVALSAVQNWCDKQKKADPSFSSDKVFFWWCFFCNNQLRLLQESSGCYQTPEELAQVFGGRLQSIGSMLIMLDKFQEPNYVKRIWCVYELFVCEQKKTRVSVDLTLPAGEMQKVADMLKGSGLTAMLAAIGDVKSEKATATSQKDEDAIKELISKKSSFGDVDSVVRGALKKQVEKVMQELLWEEERQADAAKVFDISRACSSFSVEHANMALKTQGNVQDAIKFLTEAAVLMSMHEALSDDGAIQILLSEGSVRKALERLDSNACVSPLGTTFSQNHFHKSLDIVTDESEGYMWVTLGERIEKRRITNLRQIHIHLIDSGSAKSIVSLIIHHYACQRSLTEAVIGEQVKECYVSALDSCKKLVRLERIGTPDYEFDTLSFRRVEGHTPRANEEDEATKHVECSSRILAMIHGQLLAVKRSDNNFYFCRAKSNLKGMRVQEWSAEDVDEWLTAVGLDKIAAISEALKGRNGLTLLNSACLLEKSLVATDMFQLSMALNESFADELDSKNKEIVRSNSAL